MRLERLCSLRMQYGVSSWHRPYGDDEPAEWLGYGEGSGEVAGALAGTMRWSNMPRRRQDGVWTPNLRGVITTSGGDDVLVAIHGQSVREKTEGVRRAILARVELTTQAERFRWLNTAFLVGEGEIDESREEWWLDVFVCLNEVAAGPAALGALAPEPFRQRGRGA